MGPPMITPRRITLASNGTSAYVVDDGGNASEKLFEIDLATGDRRIVGQISEQGINRSLTGVALDEATGQVYVSRYDGGTVLKVDLATEEVTPITSNDDGMLDGIRDVLFDAENHRLLIADEVTDSIVAVDLVTYQKQLISKDGARGVGEAFAAPVSLTPGENASTLYVADQTKNEIIRVDIESGDREVVQTSCVFDRPDGLQQALYDGARNQLLILNDGLFAFDLGTSTCTKASPKKYLLGMTLTAEGQALAVAFHSVMQVDRGSGDIVLVSK